MFLDSDHMHGSRVGLGVGTFVGGIVAFVVDCVGIVVDGVGIVVEVSVHVGGCIEVGVAPGSSFFICFSSLWVEDSSFFSKLFTTAVNFLICFCKRAKLGEEA